MRKLTIGNVTLENPYILAPMAGVTDLPFRLLCREMGAGLLCMEMVSAKAILYENKNTKALLSIHPKEPPVSLQLFGSEPEVMAEAAKRIEELPFSILDINIEKPVTVKIRKGFDDDTVNAVEIAKAAEAAGAKAVAVHGRTREQYYSGKADWDIIRQVKEAVSIPVIGNGDVTSGESAASMLEQTGCDGVMIGRGAQGNPWIFREILEYERTGKAPKRPGIEERKQMILRHANLLLEYKGDYLGIREMRKHVSWYTSGLANSAKLRNRINAVETMEELEQVIQEIGEVPHAG